MAEAKVNHGTQIILQNKRQRWSAPHPSHQWPLKELIKFYESSSVKPRPNIIQLWCFMKCCTRLATLLYRVLSCCILLYEVWSRSNFSLNKCCTIQHFFCFPWCCMMLYSFGHPMQLCCALLYSRVRRLLSTWNPFGFVSLRNNLRSTIYDPTNSNY